MFKKLLMVFLALLCVIVLAVYNAKEVNTKQLKIREETIRSEKIGEKLDGFLIAYFSDVCYGSFTDKDLLDKTAMVIDAYEPDLIVFGGDLFDLSGQDMTEEMLEELKGFLMTLDARYGKYAVMGDHDKDNESILQEIYDETGFTLLRNEGRTIGPDKDEFIVVTGLDPFLQDRPPYTQILTNDLHYSIVAAHYPDLFMELENCRFDICLAGHSLGGQVYFPIVNLFQRDYGCQKYYHGKSVKDGHVLDITNGIGRRNVDARFWADAEIVFYTLRPIQSGE